jgi:diguanylate cyclase (GGDEF)-like protein
MSANGASGGAALSDDNRTTVPSETVSELLAAAEDRDRAAHERDLAAVQRDQVAAARDIEMAQCDATHEQYDSARVVTGAEVVVRAAGLRKRAAEHRAEAARQREQAAADRKAAARDRAAALRERRLARADREALAGALAAGEHDALTGARTRAAGLADLERELERSRRLGVGLVVAYVDVVGLKIVNDSVGHAAGDALLKHVVELMSSQLRPYDLVIRLGGDEFLCAMSNMTLSDARRRFSDIAAALASAPVGGAMRTGFAELLEQDAGPDELIARADREMVGDRQA